MTADPRHQFPASSMPLDSGVTNAYREASEAWWADFRSSTDLAAEELTPYVAQATQAMLERLLAAAMRENLLLVSPPDSERRYWLEPVGNHDAAGRLGCSNLDRSRSVLICNYDALDWYSADAGYRVALVEPSQLLGWMAYCLDAGAEARPRGVRRLAGEVAQSVLFDALCRRHREKSNRVIAAVCRDGTHPSLLDWLDANCESDRHGLWLEQWSAEGHPLHLAPHTRPGQSVAEVIENYTEFGPHIPVVLGAAPVAVTAIDIHEEVESVSALLETSMPGVMASWRQGLIHRNLDPDAHVPLPLHPLQIRHRLPAMRSFIRQHGIVTDGPRVICGPTLSVRTVKILDTNEPLHLKLALGVRITSMKRNLSPRSCAMGPRISRLLESVISDDEVLRNSCCLLPELAGICVEGRDPSGDGPLRDLAAIVRRAPESALRKNERLIPPSALPRRSPLSGRALFVELVQRAYGTSSDDLLRAFEDYADLVLQPVLRLFLRYGITMEAHAQNTQVLVDSEGRFSRLMFRDLGGIRIHEPTMRERGFDLAVHPDRLTVSEDWSTARSRLIHAVFHMHLGHLATVVSRDAGIDEDLLWARIARSVRRWLEKFRDDTDEERWTLEAGLLLDRPWQAKSSFMMRLADTSEEIFVPSENLLFRRASSSRASSR